LLPSVETRLLAVRRVDTVDLASADVGVKVSVRASDDRVAVPATAVVPALRPRWRLPRAER
jgi:hypothetical protein